MKKAVFRNIDNGVNLTSSSSVSVGDVIFSNGFAYVAATSAEAGDLFFGYSRGLFDIEVLSTDTVIEPGTKLFLHPTGVVTVTENNKPVGTAVEAKSGSTVLVALNSFPAVLKSDFIPDGGTAGQILSVASDGGVEWVDAPVGIPAGGTAGQILSVASDGGVEWVDAPVGIPAGGTTGQVLKKTSDVDYEVEWGTDISGT